MKQKVARKAVKTTAKHTAHGAASKLKRNPLRTTTLLGLGALVGAAAGFLVARLTGGSTPAPSPSAPSTSATTPPEDAEAASPPVAATGTPPISSAPVSG